MADAWPLLAFHPTGKFAIDLHTVGRKYTAGSGTPIAGIWRGTSTRFYDIYTETGGGQVVTEPTGNYGTKPR